MASKAITYMWKIKRPNNDLLARETIAAAYQIATEGNPNVTTILIRSRIHGTTWLHGKWVKDYPHLTICSKDSSQEAQKSHEASHGYTKSLTDPTLVKVSPSGFVKLDNTLDRDGDEIWPEGLPSEVIMHRGPDDGGEGTNK
ncbi:MAG: hypothetical protein Q9222_002537 [Ikaeria aurantiellina]